MRVVLGVLFRPRISGWENLPADRPFLLVANHGAGMGIAEIMCFAMLYACRFGNARPLAGFAHTAVFKLWPISFLLRSLGAVPSTYEAAYDALEQGAPLLVFPGGDHETLRPVWQARDVTFGGRKGFVRIARKAGVGIVPVGIHGSHYTAPMLVKSRLLAWLLIVPRAFGLKRWGLSVVSVVGGAAILMAPGPWWLRLAGLWLFLGSPFVFTPIIPWTIQYKIGAELTAESLAADGEDDDGLNRSRDRVESAVQALVLELAGGG